MNQRNQALANEQAQRDAATQAAARAGIPPHLVQQAVGHNPAVVQIDTQIRNAQFALGSARTAAQAMQASQQIQALSKKTPVVAPKPLIEKKALKAKKRKGPKM